MADKLDLTWQTILVALAADVINVIIFAAILVAFYTIAKKIRGRKHG